MVEEILKSISENPELVALGAGAAYAGLTYVAGRMETYATRIEADEAKEEAYDSPFDLLKGLYDKGKIDSAQQVLDDYGDDPFEQLEPDVKYDEDVEPESDPVLSD